MLDTQAQQVLGQDVCDNNWYDVTASFYGWGTGDSSIATANGKQIHGVAAGTTTDFAQGDLAYGHERMYGDTCPSKHWDDSGGTKVQLPDHLQIASDIIGQKTSCTSTAIREINYQIVDVTNAPVNDLLSVREQFGSKSQNTCNTTVHTTESCTLIALGNFIDVLTVGCNSVGGSCGYTYTHQQWVYCGTSPIVIGTPGDLIVHNDVISVGGNVIGFVPGTYIYP